MCHRCFNCCDRNDIRGTTRDMLHTERRRIRNLFDSVKIRSLGIFYCDNDGITVVDLSWLDPGNSKYRAINEIKNIMGRKYMFDGGSDIFHDGPKTYDAYGIHLYFDYLAW